LASQKAQPTVWTSGKTQVLPSGYPWALLTGRQKVQQKVQKTVMRLELQRVLRSVLPMVQSTAAQTERQTGQQTAWPTVRRLGLRWGQPLGSTSARQTVRLTVTQWERVSATRWGSWCIARGSARGKQHAKILRKEQ
jgi:hypothetical protein